MALGTNGYLLKDERLSDILPSLTYLRYNISAAEPSRYAEIHGCSEGHYHKVIKTIQRSVEIKKRDGLDVTLGLQMVLLPEFKDQVLPLTKLGKDLGVDYLVIKHCSDDEEGSLGVDYAAYFDLVDTLKRAEAMSNERYTVQAKWSKILSHGKRCYSRCYGPPFIMQFSGSGLVAPCGMLFNPRYKKYHIGNIAETSFKELWQGDRYWEVIRLIGSKDFDARTMCGSLCLQHKVNEFLWSLKENPSLYGEPDKKAPMHVNFI
jgi:MoaA/NifB/PqqE/SkfB family radical SAM enzyme